MAHAAPHRPHEQRGVGVLAADRAPYPALAPHRQAFDERLQLAAGAGEVVAAVAVLHDAGALERAQALGQQRGRHRRDAVADLVEARAPVDQLADDQQRPALRQQLGRLCDGAELTVPGHVPTIPRAQAAVNSTTWS
jgi:hypothetical protein